MKRSKVIPLNVNGEWEFAYLRDQINIPFIDCTSLDVFNEIYDQIRDPLIMLKLSELIDDNSASYRIAKMTTASNEEKQKVSEVIQPFIISDKKDLKDLSDLVVNTYKDSKESALDFINDVGLILNKLDLEERERYVRVLKRAFSSGDIKTFLDFTSDVKYGFLNLNGNLDEALNYAQLGVAMELQGYIGRRVFYDQVVNFKIKSGSSLEEAVKVGKEYAFDGFNVTDLGKTIAEAHGIKDNETERKASGFGALCFDAFNIFGLENTIEIFVPLFFATYSRVKNVDKITLANVASLISPGITLFTQYKGYGEYFDRLIDASIYANVNKISKTPSESWIFAKAETDADKFGYNSDRWSEAVKYYINNKRNLKDSIILADELEHDCKKTGKYRKSDLDKELNGKCEGNITFADYYNFGITRYLLTNK